jgi:hypothetical protein
VVAARRVRLRPAGFAEASRQSALEFSARGGDGRRCAKHNGKDARTNRDVTNGQPSDSFRSLSAFAMTETELKVIAALAIIGLNSSPDQGYRMPAATGTPATL